MCGLHIVLLFLLPNDLNDLLGLHIYEDVTMGTPPRMMETSEILLLSGVAASRIEWQFF